VYLPYWVTLVHIQFCGIRIAPYKKKISGQENTQPLKVDIMAEDKGEMTNNDLQNTKKNPKD
jgi:hypothetical protein